MISSDKDNQAAAQKKKVIWPCLVGGVAVSNIVMVFVRSLEIEQYFDPNDPQDRLIATNLASGLPAVLGFVVGFYAIRVFWNKVSFIESKYIRAFLRACVLFILLGLALFFMTEEKVRKRNISTNAESFKTQDVFSKTHDARIESKGGGDELNDMLDRITHPSQQTGNTYNAVSSADIALHQKKQFEDAMKRGESLQMQLIFDRNPDMAAWLSNPENAMLVHDEYGVWVDVIAFISVVVFLMIAAIFSQKIFQMFTSGKKKNTAHDLQSIEDTLDFIFQKVLIPKGIFPKVEQNTGFPFPDYKSAIEAIKEGRAFLSFSSFSADAVSVVFRDIEKYLNMTLMSLYMLCAPALLIAGAFYTENYYLLLLGVLWFPMAFFGTHPAYKYAPLYLVLCSCVVLCGGYAEYPSLMVAGGFLFFCIAGYSATRALYNKIIMERALEMEKALMFLLGSDTLSLSFYGKEGTTRWRPDWMRDA